MLKRFCLILSLAISMLFFAVLPTSAETVDTAWVRIYNGPGNYNDEAHAIAVDSSGNVYVTGESNANGVYTEDYATIKYYANGNTAWVRRYNGPSNRRDFASAIAVDDSGNVYVTGKSNGGYWYYDYATIKYYANGDTAWVRRYDGPGHDDDRAYAIAVDAAGYVYVTGSTDSMIYFDPEIYYLRNYATIKYCPNGDTVWVRRYNRYGNDVAYAISVDSFGNVYVTGSSGTIKYSADGHQLWIGSWGGVDIAVDASGTVYITGTSGTDYATIRYYPNGDTGWIRSYNGPGDSDDYASGITLDGSGNVYVTGWSYSSETGNDYATIKYYPNGDTAWVRRYNGPNNLHDKARAIAVDSVGNVYVTGYCNGIYAIPDDYATIKYDSSGNQLWAQVYNGSRDEADEASAIVVDSKGNVCVTGYSFTDFQRLLRYNDYVTIKYVQTGTDVEDETGSKEKPSEFALSQNYPNPFNQSTKIEFTLAKSGFVSLKIYDLLGRKVKTLVSEHLSSGYKSVLWDGKNDSGKEVASGIYFYQLRIGDFSATKKLVLLK